MNITRLKIENFKCFGEATEIPFAPLTLIYGENGAGKSAIMQSISVLWNSWGKHIQDHNKEEQFTERYNIGTLPFAAVSHNGDALHKIDIKVECFDGQEVSALGGIFSKNNKSDTGLAENLYVESTYCKNGGFIQDVYNQISKHREVIYNNFNRYIELLVMQHYYQHILTDRSHISDALKEAVTYENGIDIGSYDSSKTDGKFCEGLEDWILFGIPGWSEFRKTSEYQQLQNHAIDACKNDMAFFSSSFTLTDFTKRYSEDLSIMNPHGITDFIAYWKNMKDSFPFGKAKRSFRFDSLLCRDILLSTNPIIQISICHTESFEFVLSNEGFYLTCSGADWQNSCLVKALNLQVHDDFRVRHETDYMSPFIIADRLDFAAYQRISSHANHFMDKIMLLPPLREAPKDFYAADSEFGKLANDPVTRRQLNRWLDKLGIGYAVEFTYDKEKGATLLLVDTKWNRMPVRISETGFGFSQMLPIIIKCVSNKPRCIMIEEPELHIHPRLQAELGSLFLDAIQQNGHQIIAETHSEHLVLRVQRLIRTGKLSPKDVCVLYVIRNEDGSSVQQLRLDDDGEFLDEWPGGFFEESFNEMFGGE